MTYYIEMHLITYAERIWGRKFILNRFVKTLCAVLATLLVMQCAMIPPSAIALRITTHNSSGYTDEDGNFIPLHFPVYHEIPLYLQTDYPDTRYGSGTIATSGCSIVSLAMVATYLTGHEYLPDELAGYFGGRAENNIARLEHGAEALQLPYEKTWYFYDMLKELKAGKVVIALMEENSIFTDSQHFIVLTGINEEGKILVHDSFAPNYDLWNLKNGFSNGFDEDDILCGFSGA